MTRCRDTTHCRQINIRDERPLNIINLADPVTVRSVLVAILLMITSVVARVADWWWPLHERPFRIKTTF